MWAYPSGDALLRNPITGIADCCARAEIGQATAAPPHSITSSVPSGSRRHCTRIPGSTLQQSVPSRTATTAVTEYEHLIFSIEIAAGHDTRDIGSVLRTFC